MRADAPSSDPAFSLEDVTVDFNSTRALDAVSLTIGHGEQVALIGPSGSGKSTLLRLLNASLPPTSGKVEINGQAIAGLKPAALRDVRSHIGWIPQSLGVVGNLSVIQNVVLGGVGKQSLPSTLRKLTFPAKDDQLTVLSHLERVGIGAKMFQRTSSLSGGQQQRVAIARTLFQQANAVLADEPVSSVDPARAEDLVSLLTTISSDERSSLVMSLHNLALAKRYFPRIIGLRNGRVVIDKPAGQIVPSELDDLYDLTPEELANDA